MLCSSPLLAARLYKPSIGKSIMKILPKRCDQGFNELVSKYGRENLIFLPCGHCPACISKRKKEWSVRCAMEALCHKENCFVTLTYAEEFYPGDLLREDLQGFIKALRNKGIKFRYFGCGERGQLGRAHFHIILFGFMPNDLKVHCKSKSQVTMYESSFLTKVWSKGIVTVQEFSPFAASYVAGYVIKKLMDRDDSFHIQSTKPGIGAAYFLTHIEDVYDTDKLVLNFGTHVFSVPRYFDKLAESLDLDLSDVKESRLNKSYALTYLAMNKSGYCCPEEMYLQEGIKSNLEFRNKKRSL